MSMTNVLGTQLATGVTSSGLTGVHEQSSTKSSVGELKVYKDKSGTDISVYVNDEHKEQSFECLIESTVQDKKVGDTITLGTVTGVVTKYDVIESNEDVKKISVTVRTFPDIQSGNSGGGTSGGGTSGGGSET